MGFITFPLKQLPPDVYSQELLNMSDSPRTVRKRTNISTVPPARWTDEDRTLLRQLRQEQSHLTWNQLYNGSHCSLKVVGPLFPGRSRSAITQEYQKMEREDAKRRAQLIKERRNDHANVSTPGKRPISDHPEAVSGRLSKEPRLHDRAAEQSSDDGGDIEYDGRRQSSITRQSPNAPRVHEIPLHSPSSVQSLESQQPALGEVQSRPQKYPSYTGVAAPQSVQASSSAPDLPSQEFAPQPQSEGGMAFLAPTHAMSPSIQSGNETNHAVNTAKSFGYTSHGNITNTTCIESPHLTNLHYSQPSNLSTQLQPQPPNPQPTLSQSPTSQPPPQPGELNKQYIETLTGDQCVDGAVTLLTRLTQVRVKEGMAQREETAALRIRIEKLESRLDAQSKQLSTGEMIANASILAMEKQMEKTRKEIEKIGEDRNAAFQRLDDVRRVIEMLCGVLSNGKDEQSARPVGAGK
ncbi:hypothetical protein BDV11DRAFT_189591 [Aspergillus similis]